MPPNIILFMPDQWRGEALGCVGNPVVKTPNCDAFAAQGVAFSNAFTQNGVCTPARCSLATGWYPHVNGHRSMHHFLRRHEPNLMRYLKDAGYFVWWGGKNDLIPREDWDLVCDARVEGRGTRGPEKPAPAFGDRHYYTFYRGCVSEQPMHLGDDDVVDHAVDFLGRRQDKPFFMWINQGFPHPPYFVEREWFDLYSPDALPPMAPAVLERKPGLLDAIRRKTGCDKLTDEEFRLIKATYYAMVSRTDRNFGRVLGAVKRAGLWDSTAIFMTSDHGDFAGDYRLVEKTQNTFEDVLTRVPLLARVPGCRENRDAPHFPSEGDAGSRKIGSVPVFPGMVESMDLFATIMEVAGVPARHTHFAKSLLPLLRGETNQHREFACCEGGGRVEEAHTHEFQGSHTPDHIYHPRITIQNTQPELHGKAVMLRTREWKYVRRLYDTDELYDLTRDPDELVNLIDPSASLGASDPRCDSVVRSMREKMLTWLLDTGDAVPFQWDKRSPTERIWEP